MPVHGLYRVHTRAGGNIRAYDTISSAGRTIPAGKIDANTILSGMVSLLLNGY